jgi:hypothetical protein
MEWACEEALRALVRLSLNGESLRSAIGTDVIKSLQNNLRFAEWMVGGQLQKPRIEKVPLETDAFIVRDGASLLIEALLDRIQELEADVGYMKDVISHLEKDVKMKQSREEAIRAMLNEKEPEKFPSRPR